MWVTVWVKAMTHILTHTFFEKRVRTTRKTGGLLHPYKGFLLAEP